MAVRGNTELENDFAEGYRQWAKGKSVKALLNILYL